MTNLVSGVLSLLTLLLLMPLLKNLPIATLAAIVIEAMFGLDQTTTLRRVFRFSRLEGTLALLVILAVLIFGVIQGIGLGVILSIVLLLERASHPGTAVLGRIPGSDTYRDIRRHPEAQTVPGLLIFRFDAELVFPSSRYFVREALLRVKESPVPVRVFLINAETINDIDVTGTMLLLRLQRKLAAKNIPLWIAQMQDPVIDKLRRLEAGRPLVGEHLYPSVKEAVADFENAQPELHVTPR
jgi:MFS superfamily sulfate permease-like transporter